MDSIIEVEGSDQDLRRCTARPAGCGAAARRSTAVAGIDLQHRARRDGRLHRPQRRREVHDDQDAHRHPRAERRDASGWTASSRAASAPSWPGASAWCSASGHSSGGTSRCATASTCCATCTGCPAARHAENLDRFAGGPRPRSAARRAGAPALARPAHARRAHGRAAPRSVDPAPRRADHRAGRGEQGGGARVPGRREPASRAPRCCSPPTTSPTWSACASGS